MSRLSATAPREPTPSGSNGELPRTVEQGTHAYQSGFRIYDQAESDLPLSSTPNDPARASKVAFPAVGDHFLSFHLIAELGRGSFGRVYLARQETLAHRPVVLKLSPNLRGEQQCLAQLQHTNIVPVYSIHSDRTLQGICMPYLGSVTLAEVIRSFKAKGKIPQSGRAIVTTLKSCRTCKLGSSETFDSGGFAPFLPSSETDSGGEHASGQSTASAREMPLWLEELNRSSYVEAVLRIVATLADGLTHAHETGILHRDLKPANILLADNGQPMLLDFNLAGEMKSQDTRSAGKVGGTVPYMSPEHLVAFAGGPNQVDQRSDIYSLGIILYELLVGRYPFRVSHRQEDLRLKRLLAERRRALPALARLNRAITPAIEAIVRKCLHPDPAGRYQRARDLKEDIDRHLAHQPLVHAPNRSLRERVSKWSQRHPRMASSSTVGVLSCLLICLLGFGFWTRGTQLEQFRAAEHYRAFQRAEADVKFALMTYLPDQESPDDARMAARKLLANYGVLDDAQWQQREWVQQLPPEDRQNLQNDVGDLLLLLARAEVRHGNPEEALRLNHLAEAGDLDDALREAIAFQRQTLEEDSECPVADSAEWSERELVLRAADLAGAGRPSQALRLAVQAVRLAPWDSSAWYIRGNCEMALGQFADAEDSYTACISLQPESTHTYFNRGLAHHRLKQFAEAAADFTRAVQADADPGEALYQRALVHLAAGETRRALEDLDQAFAYDVSPMTVWFARAQAYRQRDEQTKAQAAYDRAMATQARSPRDWLARGLARQELYPRDALADFDQALGLDPLYRQALEAKAHLLGGPLAETEEAIQVWNQLIAIYPDYPMAHAHCGIMHARAGRRAEAHRAIEAALMLANTPVANYTAACVFAQTSQQESRDVTRALDHLQSALQAGFGQKTAFNEPDLFPLRSERRFQQLIAASRFLFVSAAETNEKEEMTSR